jgi:methionine synthase II (cobalamin-independent)
MSNFSMPLWLALLDDPDWWEQLDAQPTGDDTSSWIGRAVDEIIAEEKDDDDDIDPYWKRGEWRDEDFKPF